MSELSKEQKLYVVLHSDNISAVDATRKTIEALPGGNRLDRDDGGYFVTGNIPFLQFALVRQGYVKGIQAPPVTPKDGEG